MLANVVHGRATGQFVYVDVFLARKVRDGAYTISVASARR